MIDDRKLLQLASRQAAAMEAMAKAQERRTAGHDRVLVDPEHGVVAFYHETTVTWRPRCELIGILMTDVERWRWWWALPEFQLGSNSRLNAAYAMGERDGIPTLCARNPAITTERDAAFVARLVASVSGAQGVFEHREQDRISYYALFATGSGSHAPTGSGRPAPAKPASSPVYNTMLPPATAPLSSPSPSSKQLVGTEFPIEDEDLPPVLMSLRPAALPSLGYEPVTRRSSELPPPAAQPVRVPARELIRPLAQQAHGIVQRQLPQGFRQALVIIDVDVRAGKARFSVQVVAADAQGDLVALDPSTELMKASSTLIAEDAKSGNGRWRRLTARIISTPTGASLDVHVKA